MRLRALWGSTAFFVVTFLAILAFAIFIGLLKPHCHGVSMTPGGRCLENIQGEMKYQSYDQEQVSNRQLGLVFLVIAGIFGGRGAILGYRGLNIARLGRATRRRRPQALISRRKRRSLELAATVQRWRAADTGECLEYTAAHFILAIGFGSVVVFQFSSLLFPHAATASGGHAGTWPTIATATVSTLLTFALYLTVADPRRWRDRQLRWYSAAFFARFNEFRLPYRLVWIGFAMRRRSGNPVVRARNARYFACQQVIWQMCWAALLSIVATATVLSLFWAVGLVHTTSPAGFDAVQAAAGQSALWSAADAVPVLSLPDVLDWSRPALFEHDVAANIILLIGRLAVFTPLFQALYDLVRRSEFDPVAHVDDVRVDAVIDALALERTGRSYNWPAALARAAMTLAEHDGEEWTEIRLARTVNERASRLSTRILTSAKPLTA